MLIRVATPDDVPAIRAIASQSPEAAQWSEQHYDALAAGDDSRLVLLAEGLPSGETSGRSPAEISGFLVAREIAGEWELENIAVPAHARRRGAARHLVGELVKTAAQRGARAIHLEVRSRNAAARALYERCGFRQSGRRPRYYDCPADDAILYTRELSPATPEND